MKFTFKVSPTMKTRQSTQQIMFLLTLGLMAVVLFSSTFYFVEYGIDYVIHLWSLLAVAVLVAVGAEALWAYLLKKDVVAYLKTSFPWVTAIILVLMVPISTPLYPIAIGTIFAIVVAKLLFGGFGHNVFNLAGVGRTVMLFSFGASIMPDLLTSATPISSIANVGWIITDTALVEPFLTQFGGVTGLLLGWYPGAIGETSALLIMLIGAFLAFKNVLDWRIPVFYIGTLFALASIIALIQGVGVWYPLYHIFAGGAMFGAVFMLTDPVTNPTSASGRIIFAMGAAIITILIRVQGNYPGGVVFSILIMNMLSPMIDRLTDGWQIAMSKKYVTSMVTVGLVGAILMSIVGLNMKAIVIAEPEPEVPDITLSTPISLDQSATSVKGVILSSTTEGDFEVVLVEIRGYSVLEGGYDDALPNKIEVKINKTTLKVDSVKVVEIKDTNNIGTKVDNPKFLDQFKDVDETSSVDAVSGATVTSLSVVRAVFAALEHVKGGE
jgi:Na+-translocating ferredoxin:NAD+ oxidoreductase subunit D